MEIDLRMMGSTALVFVLSACGDVLGPDPAPDPFAADGATFRLTATSEGLTTEIPFTYLNRTGGPVFVVNCNRISSVHLEKNVEGAWRFSWAGGMPDCLSPPIELRVGESFRDTLHVSAGHPDGVVEPKFAIQPPTGTYRLVWGGVYRSVADATFPYGQEIAKELRSSTPFEILEP